MNFRKIFRFRRVPPLLSLLTVLTILGCGTMAIDYSAEFKRPDEVSISMEISVTGAFVGMISDSENDLSPNNTNFEGWDYEVLEDTIDKYTFLSVNLDSKQMYDESGKIL